MSSRSKNVIRTQYLYVNTKNVSGNMPYDLSLSIPRGLLQCDNQSQSFKVSCQSFQMTRSWYFINLTNNQFNIIAGATPYTIVIPEGNYTFKQLASTITLQISNSSIPSKDQIIALWNSKTNRLELTFPSASYSMDFNVDNSAAYVMGFAVTQYSPNASLQIISVNILPATLSKSLTLWVDLSPSKGCLSLENKTGSDCEPITSILNIPNNISPYDDYTFSNNTDEYSITVAEKSITTLRLSVRNEDGEILKYISDYRATLKFEVLEDDTSYQNQIALLQEMKEMREYLRFIFLQKNL